MRTYNKRLVKFSAVGVLAACVISLVIIAHGCSSDFDSDIKIEKLEIPEEYNEVGVLHNEGLEYIFEEIKAEAIEYTKNPRLKSHPFMENKDEFIKKATLDFCNQHKKLRQYADINKKMLQNNISLKSSGLEDVSHEIRQLLEETSSVLHQEFSENELPILKLLLDAINQKAAQTLSETEASIIYCTTSTGYYSYQYWMNNYKKWYFALNYPEIIKQYNNEELNQLHIKNGEIRTKGWWDDLWNNAENWWDHTTGAITDGVTNWWNNGGKEIVGADAGGATTGAIYGWYVAVATGGASIPATAVVLGTTASAGAIVTLYITQ